MPTYRTITSDEQNVIDSFKQALENDVFTYDQLRQMMSKLSSDLVPEDITALLQSVDADITA